ncbi:MAG TPA: histidine kinase dimerization/phosphoacceptor domain -containing protein [Bryobacteraceae bacterium]|nr:histidine kinase dimerization/phosphoacceptor domain -containing protein [Bryobacteraceae bacterium]
MPSLNATSRAPALQVLIVEDDADDYELTRDLLFCVEEPRYRVQWAATYEAGMAAMRSNRYDVCLIDYHLGARTGAEFLRECTACGMNAAMILLTGHSARETDLEAMQAGAADYLDKSYLSSPLLDRSIRYSLERRKTVSILQDSKAFLRSTLDSLSTGIAIIDNAGAILSTNEAWNCTPTWSAVYSCNTGANYLQVCDRAAQAGAAAAAAIAEGIREVMADLAPTFYIEYRDDFGELTRWLALRVTRFASPSHNCVVLANENITERKAAVEQRAAADLLKVLHSELESVVAQRTNELRNEILQRQQAENRLEDSLQEKEVLLREIHHRVKNNLQVISSLLNLQAMSTTDPAIRAVLVDSQNRIVSMALIHEQLYGSHDFRCIDMGRYFKEILQHIFSSFGDRGSNVTARVLASERFMMTIEKAIPCGLIINELVSNALKHAFTDAGGQLRICLSRQDGALSIQVTDNGVGLPEKFDVSLQKSLGLRIVGTLTRQLRGRFSAQRRSPGASFELVFAEE